MKDLGNVIISPLITEKGTLVNEQGNQFVFRVRPEANKVEIRKAVQAFFKVKVENVHTCNFMGKERRVGKSTGRRPRWKKAYVTLAAGQRIDFFENV